VKSGFTAILVALPRERQTLEALPANGNCRVQVCGPGPERAGQAAQSLVAEGAGALVSWGCAGALTPELSPGALILPGRILGRDRTFIDADPHWHQAAAALLSARPQTGLSFHAGLMAEADQPLVTTRAKRAFHEATGALAVDMESAAIGRVASRHGLPFLALRAVSDSADQTLPHTTASLLRPDGRVSPVGIIRALLKGPPEWRRMGEAARGFSAACDRLRKLAGAGIVEPGPAAREDDIG